jgi:hypothetical protein
MSWHIESNSPRPRRHDMVFVTPQGWREWLQTRPEGRRGHVHQPSRERARISVWMSR